MLLDAADDPGLPARRPGGEALSRPGPAGLDAGPRDPRPARRTVRVRPDVSARRACNADGGHPGRPQQRDPAQLCDKDGPVGLTRSPRARGGPFNHPEIAIR